jgi:sulfate transport system substrate-binding protein
MVTRRGVTVYAAALVLALSASSAQADKTLLNVSYDPTREFYKEVNEAFTQVWQAKSGE